MFGCLPSPCVGSLDVAGDGTTTSLRPQVIPKVFKQRPAPNCQTPVPERQYLNSSWRLYGLWALQDPTTCVGVIAKLFRC